jgi:hypothetical protein
LPSARDAVVWIEMRVQGCSGTKAVKCVNWPAKQVNWTCSGAMQLEAGEMKACTYDSVVLCL